MANRELTGKVAVVTGASRNLGRGIAVALAGLGAKVLVHHHGDAARADALETERLITLADSEAELFAADLAEPRAAAALVGRALERFGRFDILVNNAGIILKKPFAELTEADFDRAFAVNAKAPFLLMQEAARHMAAGGRIVNIATSILGCSFPFYSVYAASKASLEHFSRALAKELSGKEITVNTVAPGALDTPFFYAAETAESVNMIKQFTGGLGSIEDVVPSVEFLVSPRSRWVSGQTLFVNGGFVTR
jgi:NAD(P)-dependent dehydrogenase (short-subunit alcohol dehydrogenase family)